MFSSQVLEKGSFLVLAEWCRTAVSHVGTGADCRPNLSATICQLLLGNGSYVVRSGVLTMLSSKRKLSLVAGLAALSLFVAGVGCRGFFVNPSLTSITITPSTVSLAVGQAQPLVATGNYDDGTTKNLTGLATWTSSDTSGTFVHLSSTGVVTGVSTTSSAVTITATYKGISGTTSVTVGQTQTITITCNSCTAGTNTISTAAVGTGTVTIGAPAILPSSRSAPPIPPRELGR